MNANLKVFLLPLALAVAFIPQGNAQNNNRASGIGVSWGVEVIPYVQPGTRYSAIAAGGNHSLALKADGMVVACGDNYYGESTVPADLTGVIAIAAGYAHSLALKSDGTVVAWGDNSYGETTVPVNLRGVIAIAAGYNQSLALKSDGTIAWGNGEGPTNLSGVIAISVGENYRLALKSDGTVVAWGANGYGQTNVPANLTGVIAIAAGYLHSLALKSDGTVVAWGDNTHGETNVPANLTGVIAISAGAYYSLALKSDGTVVAWGSNNSDGQTTVPVNVSSVIAISAGEYYSLALKSDGTVVAWGGGYCSATAMPAYLRDVVAIAGGGNYELLLKSDGTVLEWGMFYNGIPTVPANLTGVIAIAAGCFHSLALKSDGTVVAWGNTRYGQSTAPVPANLTGVVAIAAGEDQSVALKSDGMVAAWGDNTYGETNVPVNLSGVVGIAAGGFHCLALKSDGTVVAWGDNTHGETNVPANLSGVIGIAAGQDHSLALRSDGTIVAWGDNSYNQINVPANLSGVIGIAGGENQSLALKDDGTVVAWGDNYYGENTVPADLTGVVAIAAGYGFNLALVAQSSQSPGPTVSTVSFQLPGSSEWYDTGISLSIGEIVTISASGSVCVGNLGDYSGTEGELDVRKESTSALDYQTPAGSPVGSITTSLPFLAPTLPWWSLVGKVGSSGTAIEIGTGTTFIASSGGELYLSVNDNNFSDNSGSWNVTVTQNPNVAATVSNVRATEQTGNDLVDIYYDLNGSASPVSISASASTDGGATYAILPVSISGDGITTPATVGGKRHLIWNVGLDYPDSISSKMRIQLTALNSQAVSPIFTVDTRSLVVGTLSGRVLGNGSPVQNAHVHIETTSLATDTSSDGTFALSGVPAGTGYVVDVSASGYASARLTKIDVGSGNKDLGDISLTESTGQSTLEPLAPDVNPAVTTVQQNGVAYRYYLMVDSAGQAAGNVPVSVQISGGAAIDQSGDVSTYWPGATAGVSDADGIVRVRIPASALGTVGQLQLVQLKVSGKVQQQFQAQVVLSEFDYVWKQKLGAGLGVGDFLTAGFDTSGESELRHKLVGGPVASETITRREMLDVSAGVGANVGSSLSVSSANLSFSAGNQASIGANAFAGIALRSSFTFDPNSTDPEQNALKLYVDLGNVIAGVPGPQQAFYRYVENSIEGKFLNSNLQCVEGDVQAGGDMSGGITLNAAIVGPVHLNCDAAFSADEEAIFGHEASFGSAPESASTVGVAGGGTAMINVAPSLGIGDTSLGAGSVAFQWQTSENIELLNKSWTRTGQSSPYRTELVRQLSLGQGEQNPLVAWQLYDPAALYGNYNRTFTERFEATNGVVVPNYSWSVYAEQQNLDVNADLDLGLGVSFDAEFDIGAEKVNERGSLLQRGTTLYWPTESYFALRAGNLPSQSWASMIAQWGTYAVSPITTAINQVATDISDGVNNAIGVVDNGVSATLQFGQGVMNDGSTVITSWAKGVENLKLQAKRPLLADAAYIQPAYLPPDGSSNYIYGISGIYRFQSTNAFNGSGTVAISYLPSQVTGLNPTNLQIYASTSGSNSWQLVGGTANTVSNIVSATITNLGTFAVAPPMPTGNLQLVPSTSELAADGVSQMTIVVTNITLNTGAAASQPWLFTVKANGVQILNQDCDTNLAGIQVISTNGGVTLFLKAPMSGTVAYVSLASVAGDAFGTTAINVIDNTPPATPTNIVVSAGQSRIWVSWQTNREPDLAAYRVYYSAGVVGPPWNGVAAVEGTPSPVQVTGTNVMLRGLALGTNYFIAVSAVDTSGNESPFSRAYPMTTTSSPPSPPTATAVRFRPDGTNIVMWGLSEDDGYNDRDVVQYNISRAILPGGNYATVGHVSSGVGIYVEPTVKVAAGKYISYEVSAISSTGLSSTETVAVAGDTTPPKVGISTPRSGQQLSNGVVLASGTASDNVTVGSVLYQLNSSGWNFATLTNNGSNWTANLSSLVSGTNTLAAYSLDTSGNVSATNTVSFVYVVTAPLIVQTNGKGTVSPNYNGQFLQVGQNFSMTAAPVPGKGFAFTNWTGSFPTNQPKLTFRMASNLTLIANFVDVMPPSIAITSPVGNQRWSNSTFTVKGTASDNVAVASVYFQLNSNSWTAATMTNGASNWTANLTLLRGTNVLWAYSRDSSGNNSPTNKVSFLYIPSAVLTVQTNGLGGITPVDNGKLLAVGTNYTLTANPGHNWIFSNWVGGTATPYAVLSTNLSYTFPMQSNLVIEGNFVTNLFLAAQGAYNGLFAPANPPHQQTNSGSFTVNVTSSGVLSGNFFLGSETIPLINGKFDVSGAAQVHSTRHGGNPLTASLQLDLADRSLHGTVSDGSFVAMLHGDQSVFNSTHKATNYQGQYTLIVPGTNDPTVGPFGTSYGTVTLDASGNIAFAGGLADGTTSVSRSSVVSKDGFWPFYVPLYNGAGSLWGWNYFTNHTIVSAPFISWINATNSAKTAVYRSGFTNQQTTVIGSLYTATNKPLLSLTNAQVILEGGNLPFSIINQITWASNNTITVPHTAENTNGLTLTNTTKAGLISGSFLNPTNAKQTIKVNGVLLQNQTNAAGYFLGTNQSGAFILVPQ